MGDARCFATVADILVEHQSERVGRRVGQMVVVVSAMSGVTNQLIEGGRVAAEGKEGAYRQIKTGLLERHLQVVETLLTRSADRLELGGFIEDQLHSLERFYRSIAILGELTLRGCDAVASLGERLSVSILAAVLREKRARAQAMSTTDLVVTDDNYGAAVPLMDLTRQRLQRRVKPLLERGVIPVIAGYVGVTEEGVTTTLGRGGSDHTAVIVGADWMPTRCGFGVT